MLLITHACGQGEVRPDKISYRSVFQLARTKPLTARCAEGFQWKDTPGLVEKNHLELYSHSFHPSCRFLWSIYCFACFALFSAARWNDLYAMGFDPKPVIVLGSAVAQQSIDTLRIDTKHKDSFSESETESSCE